MRSSESGRCQDFSPARAMTFIFLLKEVLREELYQEIKESRAAWEDLLALEARVDEMALRGFDLYHELQGKGLRDQSEGGEESRLQTSPEGGLLCEIPSWDSDRKKDDVVA